MLQTEVFTLRKNMSTFTSILILRSRRSLAVVAGMKKRMITQNRQKSNAKTKKETKNKLGYSYINNLNMNCMNYTNTIHK